MAHSRLERIGTIFSRVKDLIKAGSMKLEDRPLWFEVYQAFPPEQEPRFDRTPSEAQIRQIFYPEDLLRAKFHKKVARLPPTKLTDNKYSTLCQKSIKLCYEIQKEKGISLEDAFEEALQCLGITTREVNPGKVSNQADIPGRTQF